MIHSLWLQRPGQVSVWTRAYLFRVSEVSPEGVINACRGLLRVTGHGLNEHLQRALQQHVHAAVVVIVVAAQVQWWKIRFSRNIKQLNLLYFQQCVAEVGPSHCFASPSQVSSLCAQVRVKSQVSSLCAQVQVKSQVRMGKFKSSPSPKLWQNES